MERLTGCYHSVRIDSKITAGVAVAMEQLKEQYRDKFTLFIHSINTDNGSELAHFSAFEALRVKIHFTHPYSTRERLVNERTNPILRRFLPKERSIGEYTGEQVPYFADEINSIPRMRLGYQTPEELFEQQLDQIYAID